MVGILLIAHAPLGSAFIRAASHVFHGCPERVEAIDVQADQEKAEVHRLSLEAIARLDAGSGVLVIADIIGGTPSNCAGTLHRPDRVEIIAGLSLPMLLRALTYRNDALDVVMEMALGGGQNGAVRVDHRIRVSI